MANTRENVTVKGGATDSAIRRRKFATIVGAGDYASGKVVEQLREQVKAAADGVTATSTRIMALKNNLKAIGGATASAQITRHLIQQVSAASGETASATFAKHVSDAVTAISGDTNIAQIALHQIDKTLAASGGAASVKTLEALKLSVAAADGVQVANAQVVEKLHEAVTAKSGENATEVTDKKLVEAVQAATSGGASAQAIRAIKFAVKANGGASASAIDFYTDLNQLDPWWTAGGATGCQCALQFAGAESFAAALMDLSGNNNNATLAGTTQPTWDNFNGLKGNGSGYASIPVTPASGQGWSVIAKFTNAPSAGSDIFGLTNSASTLGLLINVSNNGIYFWNGGAVFDTSTADKAAYHGATLAFAGNKPYINGAGDSGTMANTAWTPTSGGFALLGFMNAGVVGNLSSANIQAFAIYNTVLSASQVAAITMAMNGITIPAAAGATASAQITRHLIQQVSAASGETASAAIVLAHRIIMDVAAKSGATASAQDIIHTVEKEVAASGDTASVKVIQTLKEQVSAASGATVSPAGVVTYGMRYITIDGQTYDTETCPPITKTTVFPPSANLYSYPQLVKLTVPVYNLDGSDIRFTDMFNNLLYHELMSFSQGVGMWWVNIPVIPQGGTASIRCYYGAPAQTQHNRAWQANVWDQYFAAVYHFSQNGTLSLLDATANGENLSVYQGSPIVSDSQLGCGMPGVQTGGADGVLNAPPFNLTNTPLTIETWLLPNAGAPAGEFLSQLTYHSPPQRYGFNFEFVYGGVMLNMFNGTSPLPTSSVTVATAISTVSPTYVTATLSAGTNGTVNIYYNGALEATGTPPSGSPAIVTDTTPFLIGIFPDGNFFYGAQFCVRVSNIARSAAWITYTYQILNDAQGGMTLGTPLIIAGQAAAGATASATIITHLRQLVTAESGAVAAEQAIKRLHLAEQAEAGGTAMATLAECLKFAVQVSAGANAGATWTFGTSIKHLVFAVMACEGSAERSVGYFDDNIIFINVDTTTLIPHQHHHHEQCLWPDIVVEFEVDDLPQGFEYEEVSSGASAGAEVIVN